MLAYSSWKSALPFALSVVTLALLNSSAHAEDLFVSNSTNSANDMITRYAGTGLGTFATTPTTVATGLDGARGLAFDSQGDLFAANYLSNNITEFAAGATPGTFGIRTTLTTFTAFGLHEPFGLAFDNHGDLFATDGEFNGITEFTAGATPGTFGATTTLTDSSLSTVDGLAFDAHGDLFASNAGGGLNNQGSITEFAAGATPGTFGATTVLTDNSLHDPFGLAVDSHGDLFVSNLEGNNITEFTAGVTPGTFGATTLLTDSSLNVPAGMAFDAQGNLFVVNYSGKSITEFTAGVTPGTFGPGMVVESGLQSPPTFLAFGPSAPVPEASTTASFGLLLALGLGGVAISVRKKQAKA